MISKIKLYTRYFIEIFTETKSFESNPILGSKLFNKLGIHVVRVIIAHSFTHLRRLILGRHIPKEYRQAFRENGYILVENALNKEEFQRLETEYFSGWPEIREFIQGDTKTHFCFMESSFRDEFPAMEALYMNKKINELLNYVSSHRTEPWMELLRIENQSGLACNDPQKEFHSDTFHPTMKGWLFLENVTMTCGPFEYINGSHRLTLARLKWEYLRSVNIKEDHKAYSRRGSLRLEHQNPKSLGYGPVRSFNVNANTLLIVDTFGFHRRGVSEMGAIRNTIAYSNRLNPFVPVPIPNLPCINRLAERKIKEINDGNSVVLDQENKNA